MKIFPDDPVFVVGDVGFDGKDADGQPLDVLGRKALGQKLTELVDRINQPMVIALDGGWGSGKSHFLKLWTGAHAKELGGKAEVIYFDAFEHDYLDDPLVSLVSKLVVQGEAKKWTAKALDKVKKSAMPLVKGALRTGLAFATTGISEATGPVVDAVVGKVGEMTDDQIGDFWKQETGRIAAMGQFKKALEVLTQPKADGDAARKIVFIVDELDRCRPDYALSLLEIIKHFFAVPNVHFVLGVNLKELENSVKARYGAEIGATKYLQKFVSLTMHLPKHNEAQFMIVTASRAYFDSVAAGYIKSESLKERVRARLAKLMHHQELSLRDVQRLVTCLALIPKRYESLTSGWQTLVIGAAFLKVLHPDKFFNLRSERITMDEVESSLSLAQRPDLKRPDNEDRDWAVWAFALVGKDGMQKLNASAHTIDAASHSLDSFGDPFSWSDARMILAEMFDTFSVPGSVPGR